eukprot:CAMPEP_0175111666 /NCGR_PEP_ID=MMETSP0086_2-20121207/14954_1 /TAXON_ID=136419 /ORGANISM="Unknown Unknown, Strain D1" /LENGTH=52 /DNA_ID=CAMNT_0016390283 /DNA_START=135 /DNA_END=293 /DNA_ORIENTATION=+
MSACFSNSALPSFASQWAVSAASVALQAADRASMTLSRLAGMEKTARGVAWL